jgi:4-hydroxy-tetrahydrodipicolinate synthase
MKQYHGVLVPLVTPFDSKGDVDIPHLERLIESVLVHGCHPFVMGTTGEGLSISAAGRREIITRLGRFKRPGVTLYAAVSGVCHREMVDRAKYCGDAGVEVVVAHLPPHYVLSPSGMLKWFEALADQSPCPVMLYNIPSTTHMSIPLEIADELSRHPNIAGLKDSEKDVDRLREATSLWKEREDFSHFIGWAAKSFEALKMGSDGLVPSSANLIPAVYAGLALSVQQGDDEQAKKLQLISDEVGALYQNGRLLSGSLSALKALMKGSGLCEPFVLPPLDRLEPADEDMLLMQFAAYKSNAGSLLD